jgi:L-amino acid N-acyltransferase YncA
MSSLHLTTAATLVRPSDPTDMAAVAAIYEPYVSRSTVTFETEPPSAQEMAARREKVLGFGGVYLVAEQEGAVVGYAYAGPYRSRPAYRHTVEASIYIDGTHKRQGIGRLLMERLINECVARGFKQMVSVVAGAENVPSITLHLHCGFRVVGRLTQVGRKFDTWLDTTLLQRELTPIID